MTSDHHSNKLAMIASRKLWIIVSILLASIIARYYVPVHLPGPMIHPWKYKIISGTFGLLLEMSQLFEAITGIPHYTVLNTIVDSFDPIKIRPFDHGEVLYHDQYIEETLVRIYTPRNNSETSLKPLMVFFHGGGFFFGSIYSHDTMNYHLSKYTGAKVIAVNYRLTPTVHYPSPIEESVKVVRYVMKNHQQFLIDPAQVFLGGDSAGGNMAVVVERHLRKEGKAVIQGVLLLYPLLQLVNFRLPSYRAYLSYRVLSLLREEMLAQVTNFYVNTSFSKDELFTNQHLSFDDYEKFYSLLSLSHSINQTEQSHLSATSHPDTYKLFDANISPLLADDEILANSPATFIVACTYDVLLSDAQLYFQRLQRLNVKNVIYREYQIFHGVMTFVDFPVAFNEAFDIINDSAQFLVNTTILE